MSKGGEQMLLGLYARAQTLWFDIKSRVRDENGAVATEYVLLLALIAIAIVAGAAVLAGAINQRFSDASTCISSAPASC
jgi:Flp pilus assembly pilin Flp